MENNLSSSKAEMPCAKTRENSRLYFKKLNTGTQQAGWEVGIFGFVFRWMKFTNHKHFYFWRCSSFGKVAWFNHSIEFTLPHV